MYVTTYSSFNGNSWETMMQVVFKNRYKDVDYHRIKPSPGDFGIEGFTRDGLVFQCYCPDTHINDDRLYEKQRDKITEDLKKISIYEQELIKILGGIKIKKWIFVTPKMGHNKLITHCNSKRDEIRALNLSTLDSDFDVIIHEGDHYNKEIGAYLNDGNQKFSLTPEKGTDEQSNVVAWKDTKIDLVNNAITKNEIRLSTRLPNPDPQKVNELTNETVKKFLNGESMLRTWQDMHPENHQRFTELLSSLEEELKEKCLLNNDAPQDFVDRITIDIEGKIIDAFRFLEMSSVTRLKNYAVSYWLLNCSLYFESTNVNNGQ
ncbi:MAG: hypothetical protein J0G98_10935 [Terrimonas ferruginea]|uniref:hypothetical protein n=1 Tax=Terrimonas ferruginea TaxID=249 RepID=UPI000ABDDB2F|nr:hypothetical protein [Terrimonas ferruginea]MBN8783570.1 hypothetical protein [Terrimonas ferruginea]